MTPIHQPMAKLCVLQGPLSQPAARPVCGADAKIEFVGLTPGLVGLYQMNFVVPTGLTAGDVPIVVTQGGTPGSPVLLPHTP